MKIKVCSLFSGMGGFEFGIYKALGRENVEVVFSSEIDKFASKSYEILHKHAPKGDITQIEAREMPDFDLLCAGFPCQAFSIAGKRKGFEDTRGTLFFEVARILKEKEPEFFILENVKGLLSHDKGQTFETIKATLDELGYKYSYKVLNSKNFGVAQNRERIFIVGSRNQEFEFTFPEGEAPTKAIKDILESDIDEKFFLSEEQTKKFVPKAKGEERGIQIAGQLEIKGLMDYQKRVHEIEGISPTIQAVGDKPKVKIENDLKIAGNLERKGYFDQENRVYSETGIMETLTTKPRANIIIEEGNIYKSKHSGGSIFNPEGISPTLRNQIGNAVTKIVADEKPFRIRKLTPLECLRLQGFSDEIYYILKEHNISNTQIYKMTGNAVTSNVVSEIVKALFKEG